MKHSKPVRARKQASNYNINYMYTLHKTFKVITSVFSYVHRKDNSISLKILCYTRYENQKKQNKKKKLPKQRKTCKITECNLLKCHKHRHKKPASPRCSNHTHSNMTIATIFSTFKLPCRSTQKEGVLPSSSVSLTVSFPPSLSLLSADDVGTGITR